MFWHVVDYVWLGAAGVALIFAAIDVQRLRLSTQIDDKRATARGELNKVRMSASHVASIFHGQHDKDGGQKGIEWFKKLASELEFGHESFRWGIFLSQNYNDLLIGEPEPGVNPSRYVTNRLWDSYRIDPVNTHPVLIERARRLVQELDNLSKKDLEILRLEQELKSTDTSFKLQWPWLLALALALRLTKVTADLLRYKESSKKENPHNTGDVKEKSDEHIIVSDAP
ncbi:MAG TPA: hypothetical protein VJU86_01975 [Pyrinomonadaceae bacterium]|nr:hypothetical protein [Pyrinomonadaceae bacterium]